MPATERGRREKERQKEEEEEGECTLREVRPRFRDPPSTHTPAHRRRQSGLIGLSSASQREAFFYLNRCLSAALHITSISDSGPT
ncbi:hypothetical protein NQZ68_003560 [Dissostichus eleginoides]|nr:hypothetical protein NQZ68_003560 [Dissostichus eleginoides]